MKGFVILEIVVSLIVLSIASTIILVSTFNALRMYDRTEKKYLAVLTAENVLHALAAGAEVPKEMNGFRVSYEREGKSLKVRVDEWTFEYEVSF